MGKSVKWKGGFTENQKPRVKYPYIKYVFLKIRGLVGVNPMAADAHKVILKYKYFIGQQKLNSM